MKLVNLLLVTSVTAVLPLFGASQLELITINTSSLPAATQGYIDLEFNGGGTPSGAAMALITGFSGSAALDSSSLSEQSATGMLPDSISETNSNGDYFEGLTFGNSIRFYLQFAGSAVDNPSSSGSGSTFAVSLLDSGFGSLLTDDVNDGYILRFDISSSDQITGTTYPNANGGPSVVTIQAVPEPSSWLLGGLGVNVLAFLRRKQFVR